MPIKSQYTPYKLNKKAIALALAIFRLKLFSMDEIGEILGVSRQALSYHLRKHDDWYKKNVKETKHEK